jgi:hypothetical protein
MTRSRIQSLLVSRDGALQFLGVCPFTLWKWNLNGVLKPLTIDGPTVVYFRPDLEKLKASGYRERLKPGRRKKGGT